MHKEIKKLLLESLKTINLKYHVSYEKDTIISSDDDNVERESIKRLEILNIDDESSDDYDILIC
jgi:hypothetical protein